MGHLAKGEDLHGDQTLGELRRQYHCAAFNMVAAVITCTQKDLKFYTTFLFKEDLTKVCNWSPSSVYRFFLFLLQGLYLWDNLIDPEKVYHFEMELEVHV